MENETNLKKTNDDGSREMSGRGSLLQRYRDAYQNARLETFNPEPVTDRDKADNESAMRDN